jgi:hypothetical protein
MYWIPAIFIFFELIIISNLNKILRYDSCTILLKKYKDEKLSEYINEEFGDKSTIKTLIVILFFLILFELIYFIVGLFYTFWIVSAIYLIFIVFYTIYSSFSKNTPIENTIKIANLKGFTAKDQQLDRLLKLNSLKNTKLLPKEWLGYAQSVVKILIFSSIIYFHYQYKPVVPPDNTHRTGYYEYSTDLVDGEKSDTYKMNIYVKELEKYTNDMSKIELLQIEVLSGIDPTQYIFIKDATKKRFSSIRKTSDIQWLEIKK